MNLKENHFSKNSIIAFFIIFTLIIINVLWIFFDSFSGPVFAFLSYTIVAVLFLVKKEFMAGVIVGTAGLGVHVYEFFFGGLEGLMDIEIVFFLANLFFPIPLIFFSLKAYQELKQKT